MNKQKYNVVIIGGGFSGIVTANRLADSGLSICLIDENNFIGGQLLRRISPSLGKRKKYKPDSLKRRGLQYVKNLENKKIDQMINTFVLGIYPDNELLVEMDNKSVVSIQYDVLLFATGARERYLPFKGWTLPGVYSTGMLQVLMKSAGVLPSKKILLGGSGLFLFAVGYEILKNSGKVIGIFEQSGMMDKMKMLPLLFEQFSKFAEGGKFLSKIYGSFTPVRYRHKIVEARAKDGILSEVVIAKVNGNGKLLTGSEKIYQTDTLGIGYGFVPNIEGPGLAGCQLNHREELGGWIVEVDDHLQTSIDQIYAAGEITGVGGGPKSICEGNLAALSILKQFDKIDSDNFLEEHQTLHKERKKHLKFARLFNSLYPVTESDIQAVPDDTVICRCEDVTMGSVRKAIASGFTSFDAIKLGTRATMGNCQGRTCSQTVNDLIYASTKNKLAEPLSFRPPLKPVSIGSFSGE